MAEPARVEVVGPFGERGSVDASDLPEVLAQKGRALTPAELRGEEVGGLGGTLGAAAIGAADTLTMGGFTAAQAQAGKTLGGDEGRAAIEQTIRDIEQTNPIAHTLGSVAPLVLAPEMGGEGMAASLIKGEGTLARGARFAAPQFAQFARGVAETGYLEGAQGISEDILDHDLAAESFYVHAIRPETLYGGLINVGVAAGFKGLGKLTPKMGRAIAGTPGEVAANDATMFDDVTRAFQQAGGTSEEASAAMRDLNSLAERRAALPADARRAMDAPAEQLIKLHAGGDPAKARQLAKIYREGSKVDEVLEKEMTGLTSETDVHMTALANDLQTMERAQFGLKHTEIRRAADPTTLSKATDAVNGWLNELEATIARPDVPPPPPSLAAFEKKILREWKAQGVKAPADPAAAEAFSQRARTFAEAARESAVQSHAAEVSELFAKREALVDPVLREMFGDPATRVGFAAKDLGKIDSLIQKTRREVNIALREGGSEGVARIYTAADDSKRILGRMAKFGGRDSGVAQQFEQHIFQTRLRPMLEDSNLWGTKLAELQSSNNAAWSESAQASRDFTRRFMRSLESQDGVRVHRPNGAARSFLEGLGERSLESGDEEMVRRTIDAARTRSAAMRRTMDLPPQVAAAAERASKSGGELERLLGRAKEAAGDRRAIQAMRSSERTYGPAGIVGKLLSFATSPARSLEMLGGFRKAESEVRKRLAGESKGFLKGEKVPTVKPMLGEAERKAAVQSIEDIKKYQTDPRALAVVIREAIGDMAEVSPQMSSAVALTMARGVLALAKRAPVPLPPRFSDQPGEERYASGDLARYWRDKQLVERPPVVMQLLRSGQLHQEDVLLMKEVIPRLFAQMQMVLDRDLLEARRTGGLKKLTYQEQLGLSWMLERPLDETQTPNFSTAMQLSAANDPVNQAAFGRAATGGGRPSNLENINLERYSTLQEKLEE